LLEEARHGREQTEVEAIAMELGYDIISTSSPTTNTPVLPVRISHSKPTFWTLTQGKRESYKKS